MDAQCSKHQFDPAINVCKQCAGPFCARCLVYPFGERKPPLCIPCALVASGVRHDKRPKASWRDRRAHRKAMRHDDGTRPAAEPTPADAAIVDPAPPPEPSYGIAGDEQGDTPFEPSFATTAEPLPAVDTFEWDPSRHDDAWSSDRGAATGWTSTSWSDERSRTDEYASE